jgi:hypothetical protein
LQLARPGPVPSGEHFVTHGSRDAKDTEQPAQQPEAARCGKPDQRARVAED